MGRFDGAKINEPTDGECGEDFSNRRNIDWFAASSGLEGCYRLAALLYEKRIAAMLG